VFFRVPREGTDSMSGTIVHEVSHFNVVAATDDFRPNQSGIRALAISQPENAIRAANAYEYFAENTPFLSMPQPLQPADLAIISSTVSNLAPSASQPLNVSGVIVNRGEQVASSTSLTLELIDESVGPQFTEIIIPSINPDLSFNFQLDFQAPNDSGTYSLELCIASVTGELNIRNNCSTLGQLIVRRSMIIAPILPLLLDDD